MRTVLVVLLLSAGVAAQVPNIPTPSTLNSLAWDYTPLATDLALTGIDHFDVQWSTAAKPGPWISVGKLLTATVPPLTAGAYTVRVRACATAAADRCTLSAPLAFTVALMPAAAPSAIRLITK